MPVSHTDLFLRDAHDTDLADIIAIYNANIPCNIATGDTCAISVDSRLDWFAEHDADTYPLWVVDNQQGEAMAWLGFQRFYGRPAYYKTAELSIYVLPKFQHRGLGKFLLKKAIAASPDLGIQTLLGYIFAHNDPSINLFRRYGFEEWGLLPGVAELAGEERDLVILGRKVGN